MLAACRTLQLFHPEAASTSVGSQLSPVPGKAQPDRDGETTRLYRFLPSSVSLHAPLCRLPDLQVIEESRTTMLFHVVDPKAGAEAWWVK